jgi:hypothetical protein
VGTPSRRHVALSPAAPHASDAISLWTDCLIIPNANEDVDSVCETIIKDLGGCIQIDEAPLTAPDTPNQRKWLLAAVAHGRRRHRYEGVSRTSLPEELITLLIYSQDAHYKRAGIACVPMSAWNDWEFLLTPDWVTLK